MEIQNKVLSFGCSFNARVINGHEPDGINAPHRHDYYEVMWSLGDEGQHSIDFSVYKLKSNRVYFISPKQVHDARQLNSTLRVLTFSSDLFEPTYRYKEIMARLAFDNVFQQPYLDLDALGVSQLNSLWEILSFANAEYDLGLVESLLASYLGILARYKINQSSVTQQYSQDNRINHIELLIEKHYKSQKNCEFYAEAVNLTPKRINELMREYCGKTVTRSLIDRTCLEAKRELMFSNKPIQKISMELGYMDSSYFSRLFKKNEGKSPSEYRATMFK